MVTKPEQIRLQSGIFTADQAAAAMGLPEWRIHRAAALGRIGFNKLGDGRLFVFERDLTKIANETEVPAVRGDWFDDERTFDARFFGQYVERGSGDEVQSMQSEFLSNGLTVLEAMLIGDAQGHARYQLKTQSAKFGFRGQPNNLLGFYRIGPDRFRTFAAAIEQRLSNLQYRLHGRAYEFSSVYRHGYKSLVKQCVRRSF